MCLVPNPAATADQLPRSAPAWGMWACSAAAARCKSNSLEAAWLPDLKLPHTPPVHLHLSRDLSLSMLQTMASQLWSLPGWPE